MIKNRESFFIRIAKNDALENNLLSIILAKNPNIDISKRETFVDNLKRFYEIHNLNERGELEDKEINISKAIIDTWLNSDLRIKSIKLQSVRGFPKSTVPFGIDFTDDHGDISSMVILGGNGVGKSSIYDAIEYIFCKRIGEAELRNSESLKDEDEEFKYFLGHFNNSFTESTCEVVTKSKIFKITEENIPKQVREKINPNTHFISDFDIYEFLKLDYQGKGDYTFQNLIAKNVGLSEYLEIAKHLYQFTSYRRLIESTAVSKLNKEILSAKEIIQRNESVIHENHERINVLQRAPDTQVSDNAVNSLIAIVEQLKRKSFLFSFNYMDFKTEVVAFGQYYAQYSTSALKSNSLEEIQFLEMGMLLIEKHDNCPFCNDSKLSKGDISQHVKLKIEELMKISEVGKSLNIATKNLINYFSELHSVLISMNVKVNEELKQIQDRPEFNRLVIIANHLDSVIGNITSSDFLNDVKDIEERNDYLKDRIGYIESVISRNSDYINTDLVENLVAISKLANERESTLHSIENSLKERLSVTSTEGQIAVLINENEVYKNQNIQLVNEIKIKEEELKKALALLELYNTVKSEAIEYYKIFKAELSKETKEAFDPIKDIVTKIIGEYLYEEDRPVDLMVEIRPDEVDQETGEVVSEIITAYLKDRSKSNFPISINKYFNTFHLRLFCTMVGISIAVASRKNTGINLPLVLDDVFYASDFEQRAKIERFIKRLFELFQKHTPNAPLQLILLTHDQMIFESAISATYQNEVANMRFAKLFPYDDANEINGYKNLINNIPAYLPYRIMQNKLI